MFNNYLLIHNYLFFIQFLNCLLHIYFQYVFPHGSSESIKKNVCSNTSNSHHYCHCDVRAHTICSCWGKYMRFRLTKFVQNSCCRNHFLWQPVSSLSLSSCLGDECKTEFSGYPLSVTSSQLVDHKPLVIFLHLQKFLYVQFWKADKIITIFNGVLIIFLCLFHA